MPSNQTVAWGGQEVTQNTHAKITSHLPLPSL